MSERFKLIAEGLDVQPLLAKIAEHPELWSLFTDRQNFPGSPHKDTETIYLRWARDQSLAGGFYDLTCEDHVDTIEKLGSAIYYLTYNALDAIFADQAFPANCIGRVIITKMKPGGVITPHVDEGPYADRYDRFHVCLQGDSVFTCGGAVKQMNPGELWWFNHKLEHSVLNGPTERIHLIIDAEAPAYRAKRGLTMQRERPHELLDEARPLFEAHFQEIAHYQDIPLDINEEVYLSLEESGMLRCFTARYNGELVGYCVFLIRHSPRYSSSLQANQDILYVDKTRRGALIGKRLLDYGKERLKAEGVQVEYQHCKASKEIKEAIAAILKRHDVGKFLELNGFELIDLIYGRRLDQ